MILLELWEVLLDQGRRHHLASAVINEEALLQEQFEGLAILTLAVPAYNQTVLVRLHRVGRAGTAGLGLAGRHCQSIAAACCFDRNGKAAVVSFSSSSLRLLLPSLGRAARQNLMVEVLQVVG